MRRLPTVPLSLAGLLVVGLATGTARAEGEIRGRVVDADGRPVAGVEVAGRWASQDGGATLTAYDGVSSDEDGAFRLPRDRRGGPGALLALDAARARGAVAAVGDGEVELVVRPTTSVRARFTCARLGTKPTWVNAMIGFRGTRLLDVMTQEAAIAVPLPPAAYDMTAYGSGVERAQRTFVAKEGEATTDLGEVDLPPTKIALATGKTAPSLTVTDARGVAAGVRLEDYRGRWVLVEFWAHW